MQGLEVSYNLRRTLAEVRRQERKEEGKNERGESRSAKRRARALVAVRAVRGVLAELIIWN